MALLQLNPPIPIDTPKGPGMAHFLIDYGPEADLIWVCFLENKEIWSYQNREIRAQQNITLGRCEKGWTYKGSDTMVVSPRAGMTPC